MLSTEVNQLFLLAMGILVISQISTILSFQCFTNKRAFRGILFLAFGFSSNLALLIPILFGQFI